MKSLLWKEYQKEVPDDKYFFVRSCIRQTFFPGAETSLLKLLREELKLDIFEDSRHTTCTETLPASDLAKRLGCAFEKGPTGPFIWTDERRQTSVSGVFAAGDAASPMPQATLAAAAGVVAAGSAHQSIIFDKAGLVRR